MTGRPHGGLGLDDGFAIACPPQLRDDRVTAVHTVGEPRLERTEPAGVPVTHVRHDGPPDEAVGAQTVQEGTVEARLLGEARVDVERVAVAWEPIDRSLFRARVVGHRDIGLSVGGSLRPAGGRPAVAAEASGAAHEQRGLGSEQRAVIVRHHTLAADHRRRALVPHVADTAGHLGGACGRDLSVHDDRLLAVEDHHGVHLDAAATAPPSRSSRGSPQTSVAPSGHDPRTGS